MSRDIVRLRVPQVTDHPALGLSSHLNAQHMRSQIEVMRDARWFFIEFCGNPPSIAGEICVNTAHNQRCISNISDYTVANIVKKKLELPPQGCSRSGVL